MLQDLYGAITHREVKRELLDSMTDDRFADSALSFLIETAQREPDRVMQREAIEAISDIETAEAIAALRHLLSSTKERELKKEIIEALGDMDDDRAVSVLAQAYDASPDEEMKDEILEALADAESSQALQKLMTVAQRDPSAKRRRHAIEL